MPNAYEEKRVGRVIQLRRRADKLDAEAGARRAAAQRIADRIPLGQPILVGHHSEKRHRRDLARMQRDTRAGFELESKAARLRARAQRAEANTAVSSDDPDAIPKLRAKLAEIEARRERLREASAALRAGGDVVGTLRQAGFDGAEVQRLHQAKVFSRSTGLPRYIFQNLRSEATRIQRRIEELEQRVSRPVRAAETIGEARIYEDENRVRVEFPSKPAESLRGALKGAGFRWAPSVGAWQRRASASAWDAARRALGGT